MTNSEKAAALRELAAVMHKHSLEVETDYSNNSPVLNFYSDNGMACFSINFRYIDGDELESEAQRLERK